MFPVMQGINWKKKVGIWKWIWEIQLARDFRPELKKYRVSINTILVA
jgi:hypothetical protein